MNEYSEFEIIEKKSRFIACLFPIDSEESIDACRLAVRKKHPMARHYCFAYVLGYENPIVRCSDDGEPSGTAGQPILQIINSFALSNVLLIVVRYFGGTLLGTGGLVRAYQEASKQGILHASISTYQLAVPFSLTFDYTLLGKLQYVLANLALNDFSVEYSDKVILLVNVPHELADSFAEKMLDATNGHITITHKDSLFIEHT